MNSIDGFSSMMGMSGVGNGNRQSTPLTDDQKNQVQTILSKYDPKNLTAQNAQDILSQLQSAGIKPGKDLRNLLKTSGFSMHELRSLAGNDGTQSTQTSQNSTWGATLTDDQKSQLQSILSQFDPKSLTASDAQSIFKQLQQAGIKPGSDLINTLQSSGYNPSQLASLAAPQGGHRHHHGGGGGTQGTSSTSQSNSVSLSTLQSLQTILDKYNLNNMSSDQETSLQTELNQSGLLQSGQSINLTA